MTVEGLPGSQANPFLDATDAAVQLYNDRGDHLPTRSCLGCGSGPWWVDGIGAVHVSCRPAGVLVGGQRVTWARIRRHGRGIRGTQIALPL